MRKLLAPLLWCLAACVVKKENPIDTIAAAASSTSTVVRTDTVFLPGKAQAQMGVPSPAPGSPQTGGATPPVPTTPATWSVTERGIGPLRAGMTVAEASSAVGGGFSSPTTDGSCSYARFTGAPSGVAVMLENNKVARIEVRSGSTATAAGGRIGDTEARIKSLYPGRVTVSPQKYDPNGHYLTVTPVDKSSNRIVFETDGKVVTNYRSGALPAVEYVERCG